MTRIAHSNSRRRSLKTNLRLAFSREHESGKIPTIPAEIRTSPFLIWSLLTVVSSATTTNRTPNQLIVVRRSELIQHRRETQMEVIGLLVTLEARAGKEAAAEAFLRSAQPLALDEKGTLKWYAFRLGPRKFGIFDTFANEAGRNAHLTGEIAKALGARASELFAVSPQVEKVEILASTPLKG
jgi:quinol monooxygenase YgiN